ncbi:MAG TPA: glutathione synthase, partial [Woeseiaceae bacterium]|nr:glutathione synthase [Woeseiaceae bacterium]
MPAPTRRLGVVMDPIQSIVPKKDSTLAMLLEAERRGAEIHYMLQSDLRLQSGDAFARSRRLFVRDDPEDWFSIGEAEEIRLADLDFVLMRKDPPFDMEFIYTSYVLERAESAGLFVVNRPRSLRDINEKAFTTWFADCAPPTLITRSMDGIRSFLRQHRQIVLKPLDAMGGRSIFVIAEGDRNTNVIVETLTDNGRR